MNDDKNYVYSATLPTGELLETIYDPELKITRLAIKHGDQVEVIEDCYQTGGRKYWPLPADSDLLENDFVKLPSDLIPYKGILQLYQEVKDHIACYVKLPDKFLTIATVYVLMTWVYDRFQTLPYLRVLGDYGTGKSRFQQVMASLCYKAMLAGSSISMAALFRTINEVQGTLVYDEADFRSSELWNEIIKILNSGHTANVPVLRMQVKNESMKTKAFKVYGPKILASRERFSDEALESRCLTQHLFSTKNAKTPVHLPLDFSKQATAIRNKLLAFRLDNFFKILPDESTTDGIEFPRLKQSALAITSLASMIGQDVLSEVKSYLQGYEKELQTSKKRDPKVDVLIAILRLTADRIAQQEEKMYIKDIKHEFELSNSDEYMDGSNSYKKDDGTVFVYPKRTASARKIGVHVRNLGIQTERDSGGFYIPISQEIKTIEILADQFDLRKPWQDKKSDQDDLKLNAIPKIVNSINPDDIPF